MDALDIREIINRLPHRYPFLLVDRILEFTPGQSLQALKNVTINEPFFQGHFPHHPIMPGVLIIEAMAQAAAMLAYLSEDKHDPLVYLLGVDNARFRKPVVPGDQLLLNVTLEKQRAGIRQMAVDAMVNEQIVASATLMATLKAAK